MTKHAAAINTTQRETTNATKRTLLVCSETLIQMYIEHHYS